MDEDDAYKEIEEFEKVREKDPFDVIYSQTFQEKETKEENEESNKEFEEIFETHMQNFYENPCVFNLVDILEDVKSNSNYNYQIPFDLPFLKQLLIFLKDPNISYDNCSVLLNFFIALLELPDTQFSYKLCDEGIIPILYDTVMKDKIQYWVNTVACLSLLMKNNYDNYKEQIAKMLFKPVLASIESSITLESRQASLLFAFSCCQNYKLNNKQIKKLVEVLSYALQFPDYLSLYYTLSSLLFICRKYPDSIKLLSTTKITMGLALFLPNPNFDTNEENNDIFSRVLDIFDLIFKGDPDASYTFPFTNIFPRILDILDIENNGLILNTLDVIDSAICHFYGGAINFLSNGLTEKLNNLVDNSIMKIKLKALTIFYHLCQYSDPQTVSELFNDQNIEPIFAFIHSNASSTFIDFSKALITAITKCDEAGIVEGPRDSLLKLDIPTMIREVLEEIDENDSQENETIDSIGNQLLQFLEPQQPQ